MCDTLLQVMVFVHARNATVKTATALRDLAASYGHQSHFMPEQSAHLGQAQKQVSVIMKQVSDSVRTGQAKVAS